MKSKEELTEIYDNDYKRVLGRMPSFQERISKDYIPKRYKFFARYFSHKAKLLDVGCYDGYPIYLYNKLADGKEMNMHGLDVSNICVEECKKNLEGRRFFADAVHAMAENIPFEDHNFDIVTCSEVLEHTEAPIVVLKEMYRVLKDNGFLIVSIPRGKNLMDKLHLHFFNYYDLMELFDKLGSDYKIFRYGKSFDKDDNIYIIVVEKGKRLEEDDNDE